MKTLLVVTVVLWLLTWWSFKAVDRAGDDFGAVVWPIMAGGGAIVCTAALFVWALIRGLT